MKDLGEGEIEKIIAATRQPGKFHRDIAVKFRVSADLVSRLAREAVKAPEKAEARRLRKSLQDEKIEVIEARATQILKALFH